MFDNLKYIKLPEDHFGGHLRISKKAYKKLEADGYDIKKHFSSMPWATKENYVDKISKLPEYKYICTNGANDLDMVNMALVEYGINNFVRHYYPNKTEYSDYVDEDVRTTGLLFEMCAHYAIQKEINKGVKYLIPFAKKTFEAVATPERTKEYEDFCKKYVDSMEGMNKLAKEQKATSAMKDSFQSTMAMINFDDKLEDQHMFGSMANNVIMMEASTMNEDFVDKYALKMAKKIAEKYEELGTTPEKDFLLQLMDTYLDDERSFIEVTGYGEIWDRSSCRRKIGEYTTGSDFEELLKKYYPFFRRSEKYALSLVRDFYLETFYGSKDIEYKKEYLDYELYAQKGRISEHVRTVNTFVHGVEQLCLYCIDLTTGIHGYCATTRYSLDYSTKKEENYGQRPDFINAVPIDPSENIFPLDKFFEKHNFKFMDGSACKEFLKTEKNEWKKVKSVVYDVLLSTMYTDLMDIKNCYRTEESAGGYMSACSESRGLYGIKETGTGTMNAFFYRIGAPTRLLNCTYDF